MHRIRRYIPCSSTKAWQAEPVAPSALRIKFGTWARWKPEHLRVGSTKLGIINVTDEVKYYLTTSNFRKLVFNSHIVVGDNIVEAYRQVFEGADLTPYLNHKEVKSLLKSILFLQKSESALVALEKASQKRIEHSKRLDSPSNFLFVAGAPKYHANSNCETLRADFENFEVPEEISNRGSGEVKSFREFALQNRRLLTEGR